MKTFNQVRTGPLGIGLLALLFGCCSLGRLAAQTGTFIDRQLATDLRVVSYNIYIASIFPDVDATQAEKFSRVVNALDPDILNLQEIRSHSAADVINLMNSIAPLTTGTWYAHKSRANVIVSKYPLSMLETSIDPNSDRSPAIALVDIPDAQSKNDFYVINHHFVAGSTDELRAQKQRNADATIRWIQDARTPGGSVDLPPGTPIVVVGDLNDDYPTSNILNTLLTGDVINEGTYGPDAPPDWDGSSFTEASPLHNGSGPEDFTFRGLSGNGLRIDHIIYSDSALDEANKFILNTVDMSPAELAATGLQAFDVTIDSTGENYDHLPVVIDFRVFDFADSDFNFDRSVDNDDLTDPTLGWEARYGIDLDGSDFLTWQRQLGSGINPLSSASVAVPEPSSSLLLVGLAASATLVRFRANS